MQIDYSKERTEQTQTGHETSIKSQQQPIIAGSIGDASFFRIDGVSKFSQPNIGVLWAIYRFFSFYPLRQSRFPRLKFINFNYIKVIW